MINKIKALSNNIKVRQATGLYAANMISIPLMILTSIVLTRILGAEDYGNYSFIRNILNFASIIFTFGFFQAGNRALVLNSDEVKRKEYYGSELLVLIVLFVIMGLCLLLYGLLDNNIAEKGVKGIILLLIPFSWVFLLVKYFETLFPADNKINLLSLSRILPKIVFLILVVVVYFIQESINKNVLLLLWLLNIVAFISTYIFIIFKIKISFKRVNERIKEILQYNKQFGLHVYTGSLFAVGLNALTGVLISYFSISNAGVGYYGLAISITSPLAFIPNVIATTHYKDFSKRTKISKKILLITLLFSLSAFVAILVLVGPFIHIFYGEEFNSVIPLTMTVSIGVLLYGFADIFNRFLGANGQGINLRNSSIINGLIIFIFNIALIPRMGETGAGITKIITGIAYLSVMLFYYLKYINKRKDEKYGV